MQDYVSREICDLADRWGKKLTGLRIDDYREAVERFDPHILKKICKDFAKRAKSMPVPEEVENACRDFKNYIDKEKPQEYFVCKYDSPAEGLLSRNLCSEVTSEDAKASIAQGWGILCGWHYACRYAKASPASSTATMVKTTLRAEQQASQSSATENEFFLRTLGFNPFDPDPAKKTDSEKIRQAMAEVVKNVV